MGKQDLAKKVEKVLFEQFRFKVNQVGFLLGHDFGILKKLKFSKISLT